MTSIPKFGDHREQIWQTLAEKVGGTFVDEPGASFDKVIANADPWTVTLDVHAYPGYKMEQHFTRMRAPYVNADGFTFVLHKRNLFEQVQAKLGLHNALGNAETGHEEIDKSFIVRTNNPEQLKRLFNNDRLRQLVIDLPNVHLQVKPDDGEFGPRFPQGVDELYFEVPGEINNLDQLKNLYDLFSEVLHTLCHIGSAYESDPHLPL